MVGVRDIFAGRTIYQMNGPHKDALFRRRDQKASPNLLLKLLEIELGIMYDDLYTKATVLRTMAGIIARCISQLSMVVALVLFLVSRKQMYSKVDVVITYVLFLGGCCLDVCAAFVVMMSPWTWLWLQARKCLGLDELSWFLISTSIGWSEKRPLWSNSMGQYSLLSYVGQYSEKSSLLKQRVVMKTIRKTVDFVGHGKGALFLFSKSLDTTYVEAGDEIMQCVAQGGHRYSSYGPPPCLDQQLSHLPKLALSLRNLEEIFHMDYGAGIVLLHITTEAHLSEYPPATDAAAAMVHMCRKVFNYMMYLFVIHPGMLPVSGATETVLKSFVCKISQSSGDSSSSSEHFLRRAREALRNAWDIPELEECEDTLKEIRDVWIRLLVYAAGKSRPEKHAAQLARGGELLTFAWLLLAHEGLGDSGQRRIELSNASGQQGNAAYVFHF